ncbi:hypothetical protein [Chryseobacterium caseinilyticum]|uniref:Uncharacterized protein n=1 Tax=Chryseobacterium caseinilyticum TaxID=2771428 RepID=A0ABR8ZF93_9FLAO|nr:hypothetical protein [Chryseobacterium caseinilyticum]MBD8083917.1 hypothetical protein [Chryseobacterium caseinilyticum]
MPKKDLEKYIRDTTTPKDYSESKYLVYVELYKRDKKLKKIISEHCKVIKELEFGYLCEAHLQAIPEITRSLSSKNHAVYQIVRLARIL